MLLRPARSPRTRRRRLLVLAVPLAAIALFVAGALAQRSGRLSGAMETISRWAASLRNPSVAVDALSAPALPELRIDVGWEAMNKIRRLRDEAIERGVLFTSSDGFVPATLRLDDGTPLRAKIRLKGDILDHVMTTKWSFRIHMKGTDRLMRMRRLSIQHPKTRGYVHEWAFLETMRREGILAPRYDFVDVVLNGESKGIYALEEAFAKEMIESQSRREGLILKLDEDAFHRWFHEQPEKSGDVGTDVNPVNERSVLASPFDDGGVLADPGLVEQWRVANRLLTGFFAEGTLRASEVFDADLLGRYFAVCEFWGSHHALRWGNIRFYYNPLNGKIEPVAYDGGIETPGGTGMDAKLLALSPVREGLPGRPWTIRALEDPAVARAYLTTLERILKASWAKELEAEFGTQYSNYVRALRRPGEHTSEPLLAEEPWFRLGWRAEMLARALDPARHVLAIETTDAAGRSTREVANVLSVMIQVDGPDGPIVLPGRLPEEPLRWVAVPGDGTVRTRLLGTVRARDVVWESRVALERGRGSPLPVAPTVDEALGRHAFLRRHSETELVVTPGDWRVDGDLLVPTGFALRIGPGTRLRFAPGALLLTSGSVQWKGSPDEPIRLEPIGESWGGIAVLEAPGRSFWEHVHVTGTSLVARDGWRLTGGVTFYRSDVTLRLSSFDRHFGSDDQLNVFRADILFDRVAFGNCEADAFDGDFVTGRIVGCGLHDVGGDALDFSGSTVTIEDLHLYRIADKGVSGGEGSRIDVARLTADAVNIGIAAKDLSIVRARDVKLSRARFGVAAYQKKPEYGPGTIEVERCTMDAVEQASILDPNSRVVIDGRVHEGSELSVKKMYEEQILGN